MDHIESGQDGKLEVILTSDMKDIIKKQIPAGLAEKAELAGIL
ncbi:MAG: hypothetical protein AB9844_06720 [Clostridiaceae bacterium]